MKSKKITVVYSLEEGAVTERVIGKLDKKACGESTIAIIGENGEEKFVGINQLHRASFEIKDAYQGDVDIVNEGVIDGRTVVCMYYSDKILGRRVFPQEYPVFYAYKFDKDDRISEFTAGVITSVNRRVIKSGENDEKVQDVKVYGWRINKESCDEVSADLTGNMAVAREFDYTLDFGVGVRKYSRIYNLTQSIMDFNSDPYGYFSGANGNKKHKSIFNENDK